MPLLNTDGDDFFLLSDGEEDHPVITTAPVNQKQSSLVSYLGKRKIENTNSQDVKNVKIQQSKYNIETVIISSDDDDMQFLPPTHSKNGNLMDSPKARISHAVEPKTKK